MQPTSKAVSEPSEGKAVLRPCWLFREWWQFVLDDSRCPDKTRGDDEWLNGRWWQWIQNHDWRWSWWVSSKLAYLFRCQCRARSHPYGVVFYNAGGLEPDMTCNGCGEDLG
jgi:hypothetical protein